MKKDLGVVFVFGAAFFCLMLALIAGKAYAADDLQTKQISTLYNDPVSRVIQQQMSAIQERNAEAAYSLLTEETHGDYDNAQTFLTKMRYEYRPLYNYKEYSFKDRYDVSGALIQKVEVTDLNGELSLVIFRLEQQGGDWRIDSVTVLETDAQPI